MQSKIQKNESKNNIESEQTTQNETQGENLEVKEDEEITRQKRKKKLQKLIESRELENEIKSINLKLNVVSQTPNNNIGLTNIFRRLRMMDIQQQKQFMFGLFVEYIKYFSNAINEIVQMIKAKDQLARTDLIQKNEKNILAQADELKNILILTQRIAYYCPVQYISDPFFIVYAMFKQKVDFLHQLTKNYKLNDYQKISQKQDSQYLVQDIDLLLNFFKNEVRIQDLSQFLVSDWDQEDIDSRLRNITEYPFQLLENPNLSQYIGTRFTKEQLTPPLFYIEIKQLQDIENDIQIIDQNFIAQLYQVQQYQFIVVRVDQDTIYNIQQNKLSIENISEQVKTIDDESEVKDEYFDGNIVNLQQILKSIFLIDGRIYKHYQLLSWFPSYMEYTYKSQLLIMDNNDLGDEQYNNVFETQIFPRYVNYYFAIMAVSCYQCEYLLHILYEQFLLADGPIEWLIYGLPKVDKKVKRISELNEKLAYKPLSIKHEDIKFLQKKGETQNENWTINEILKASLILITYHGLCGLSFGMGINIDIDIVLNLQNIVGPAILELLVSQETLQKIEMFKFENSGSDRGEQSSVSNSEVDADSSSVTSMSQRSDSKSMSEDKQYYKILKYLKKNTNKKQAKKMESQQENCNSQNNDESEEEESDEDLIVDLNFEPNINKKQNKKKFLESSPFYSQNFDEEDKQNIDSIKKVQQLEEDLGLINIEEESLSSNELIHSLKSQSHQPKKSQAKFQNKKENSDFDQQKPISKQKAEMDTKEIQKTPIKELDVIFSKHRLLKIEAYENFDHKNGYLDSYLFSWSIQGLDVFTKFLPMTSKLINEQINLAFSMTKNQFATFQNENIDTSDFRFSIIYYLKNIHGIRDETFIYKKINEMFNIRQKTYIKNIVCKPHDITLENYQEFLGMLYDSEKCHVCVIAMETKKQISLLYIARALSEYMNQS